MKATEKCHLCHRKISYRGSLGSDTLDGVEIRNEDLDNGLLGYICIKCAKIYAGE